ncbi:MAG: adenylate/guanylate cyclase domain-containing protein, partial [Pseudomonadota bacterium]|nr:adenylate/guanylate cyclase domain-containing protein [Pseudomonadota bacterium]
TVTRTLIYSLMIVGLTWLIGDVMFGLDGILKDREMWMMLVFALIGIFFINIMFATARLIGPRVFVKFLTGHYYNPRQERRILMFLDMVGSTTIAEKIGDMRYYDLLTDVFERLSYVVDDFGGEIHNYVGDELIATWPVSENNTADNARPVECSVECFNMIAEHAEKLRARHGIVPGFRVGIHLGVIVAGELGGLKQAIVYLGDAMNTASRIERACRIEDKSILVSQALVDIAKLPPDIHVEPIGERQLKGRREPIHLHAVGFDEVKA